MTRPRFRFTPQQSARLTELYPTTLTADLAGMFGCQLYSVYNAAHWLGLRKDIEFICQTEVIARSCATCFKKGPIPKNHKQGYCTTKVTGK